jgi:hypothetical protein
MVVVPRHVHQDKVSDLGRTGRVQCLPVVVRCLPIVMRCLPIVIPGLDPGIPANSGGSGDPRIKSGDDDGEKIPCLHLDPYLDAHRPRPAITRGTGAAR